MRLVGVVILTCIPSTALQSFIETPICIPARIALIDIATAVHPASCNRVDELKSPTETVILAREPVRRA